jgi:hypothetical protein
MVDNNTCSNENFNGYVQAACEVEASLNGRIPFSVDFIPNPACKKWDLICSAVPLASVTVVSPGFGYVPATTPAVTFLGGGGSGAIANAVIGNGGIKTWTVTNGGAGYLGGGSGTITAVPAQNIVGAGVGGTFDVTVVLGVITVLTLNVGPTSPGTGYVVTDTFDFNNAFLGGTGAGAIITVDTLNTGQIQYINLTNPGAGYSSIPTASVPPPGGGLAPVLLVVLGVCPDAIPGLDCSGFDPGTLTLEPLGFIYKMCAAVAPVIPVDWIVAENGCCYDCVGATFMNNEATPVTVTYITCTAGPIITSQVLAPGLPTLINCIVNDSWTFDPFGSNVNVVVNPTPQIC